MSIHGLSRGWGRPLHRLLLAFPIGLFTFALFTDIAYLKTAEIQWTNFSAWLITGALVFGGIAGLLCIADFALGVRRRRCRRALVHLVALALAWVQRADRVRPKAPTELQAS